MHPITQRLPIHPPNARRGLTAHAVPDRGQREQATRLVGITTCRSSLPKLLGTHPLFERNRHHAPRPRISRITGDGITAEDPGESSPPDSKRRSLRVSLFAGWYKPSALDGEGAKDFGRRERAKDIRQSLIAMAALVKIDQHALVTRASIAKARGSNPDRPANGARATSARRMGSRSSLQACKEFRLRARC